MRVLIGGLKKSSLLDYPDKISAIVFMQGCNFNCGYCHNPGLLNSKEEVHTITSFFEFLEKRKNKLDGVVISGGEATLQQDLIPFIQKIKQMGFLVKLDTNGSKPHVLDELVQKKLVDYIAMDIKAPFEKYSFVTRVNIDIDDIKRSIEIVMNSNIDYEFRTTILSSQLSFNDFEKIGEMIKGAKKYYLQKFEVQSEINDSTLKLEETYSACEFEKIKEIMKKYVQFVDVR